MTEIRILKTHIKNIVILILKEWTGINIQSLVTIQKVAYVSHSSSDNESSTFLFCSVTPESYTQALNCLKHLQPWVLTESCEGMWLCQRVHLTTAQVCKSNYNIFKCSKENDENKYWFLKKECKEANWWRCSTNPMLLRRQRERERERI